MPLTIAHRGASDVAPENTLAAFQLAWELGVDGIEGDFHLTRDGAIVCMHDYSTGKTAGQDLVLAESTFARLRELDVGAWKGARWVGERMPTLPEVLATLPKRGVVFVELKCGAEIVRPFCAVLERAGLDAEQVVVIAFSAEVLVEMKRVMPVLKTVWLTGFDKEKVAGRVTPSADEILAVLDRIGAAGVDCFADEAVVDGAFVQRIHQAGKEVHLWVVDDEGAAGRFARMGVNSITTNRPAAMRRVFQPSQL